MRSFAWVLVSIACLAALWAGAIPRGFQSKPARREPGNAVKSVRVAPRPVAEAPKLTPDPAPLDGPPTAAAPGAAGVRSPLSLSDIRKVIAPQSVVQAAARARRALGKSPEGVELLVQGAARWGASSGSFNLMFNRRGCYLQEVEGPITVATGFDGHAAWALAATAAEGYSGADITLPEGLIAVLTGRWAAEDGPFTLRAEPAEPGVTAYTICLTPTTGGAPLYLELDPGTWLPETAYRIRSGLRDTWKLTDYRRVHGMTLPHHIARLRGAETDAYIVERVSPAPAFSENPYQPAGLRLARIRTGAGEAGEPGSMRG